MNSYTWFFNFSSTVNVCPKTVHESAFVLLLFSIYLRDLFVLLHNKCVFRLVALPARSLLHRLSLNVMSENVSAVAKVVLASLLYNWKRQRRVMSIMNFKWLPRTS